MANADSMVHITQGELEQLIGENRSSIGESKEGVIGEDSSQTHRAGVEDGFSTEAAETGMAMDDFDLFANDNVAENREEREDRREGGLAIDDEEGNVIDLKSVGEISDTGSTFVGMCDDDNLVSSIDQFLERTEEYRVRQT